MHDTHFLFSLVYCRSVWFVRLVAQRYQPPFMQYTLFNGAARTATPAKEEEEEAEEETTEVR